MIPVEVDMVIGGEWIIIIPKQLGKVTIDQPLDVIAAGLYSQIRDVFRHFNFSLELRERLAKFRQWPQHLPGLLGWHARNQAANIIVGELANGTFLTIDVKQDLATWFQHRCKRLQGLFSRRCVMQHAFGKDRVKAALGKRKLENVGL